MGRSFTILRVRGIPIGVDASWLLIFGLIAWSLGSALFPRTYPGLAGATYWTMGVVSALLIFGSVLLHEMGHALVGLREGVPIKGITLWLLGGVARLGGTPRSPGAEFRVAIAGPLVSVLIVGVTFGLVALGDALGWIDPVQGVLDYTARVNAVILGFNLVPALPLDGGRMLRSWLWKRQESFDAATVAAGRAGQAFGVALIAIGVLSFFGDADFGGIWFAILGWFLLQASGTEVAMAAVARSFRGLKVGDLMTRPPETFSPEEPIERLLERLRVGEGPSTFPVVDRGRLVGLVSLRAATRLEPAERASAHIADVMVRDDVPTVRADDDVMSALPTLQESRRAVVTDDGDVAGVVSASDVVRVLERDQEEGPPPPERPGRRAPFAVWLIVGSVIAVAAGYLYHPPLLELAPGETVDVSRGIEISGVATDEMNGRYLLTSVTLGRPNALGALWAWIHPDRDIVTRSAAVPTGVELEEFVRQQREIFAESRLVAAAAAAQAVGMDVPLDGSGARVAGVLRGSPAAGKLRAGDVIVAVDGQAVRLAGDLAAVVRSSAPGSELTLTVERDERARQVTLRSRRLARSADDVGIGVLVRTRGLSVDLPFEIEFAPIEAGGPSAGLAYALAVADLLDPADLARGRRIAATGTISVEGDVGEVGGIPQKAEAVEASGADLFLVPAAEVRAARGEGTPVRGVETLRRALAILRAA